MVVTKGYAGLFLDGLGGSVTEIEVVRWINLGWSLLYQRMW